MIERITPTVRPVEKIFARIRPLALALGLLLTPVPAKTQESMLRAEPTRVTHTENDYYDSGYDLTFEDYSFEAPPQLRDFLKDHPSGKKVLQLETDIQQVVKKLRQKAAICDEIRHPAKERDVEDEAQTFQKFLSREAHYTSGINTLANEWGDEEGFSVDSGVRQERVHGGSGDGGGEGGGTPFNLRPFDSIPESSYSGLLQEGSSLLADLESYLTEIENDEDKQAALKFVLQRVGCLVS